MDARVIVRSAARSVGAKFASGFRFVCPQTSSTGLSSGAYGGSSSVRTRRSVWSQLFTGSPRWVLLRSQIRVMGV